MDSNSENTGNLPNTAPAPQAASTEHASGPAPTGAASTPAAAQDTDRIEKEWIIKTRQILQSTINDPYEQAKQIAALRADYMAKRYNKIIKADN